MTYSTGIWRLPQENLLYMLTEGKQLLRKSNIVKNSHDGEWHNFILRCLTPFGVNIFTQVIYSYN
jgi:hypothetical protein